MRPLLPVVATVLVGGSAALAPAADTAKPNTLTPKEIAAGWLLLFDGETTFGWTATPSLPNRKAAVVVEDGKLVLTGEAADLKHNARFGEYEMGGEYRTADGFTKVSGTAHQRVRHIVGNSFPPAAEWTPFTVVVSQKTFRVTMNGKVTSENPAGTPPLPACDVGFTVTAVDKPEARLELRSLKLRPTSGEPLFNGKDLTGWKVFKDDPAKDKATFTVTPAGELHVLGGPGDIQTERKFADFVLQTDAKTAGPTVNAGIFFRCVPGQFQNGYECQIQNGTKDGDRTKPLDFGTGAIYRRVPARKVVSSDKEWFTLTLIATGPHVATWVNGYQVVDWTDDRKPDENPRKGLRTEAGHLSIQGHNPPMSADVLFRNLRIADLTVTK